ncbi:MAG: hypothetical protein COB02_02150 [Candidatus Cloacimonadota bacterium]|nr:MAG: hypothetical protein COB02_02150 [Candidatus Cloacimonadota bacterium]
MTLGPLVSAYNWVLIKSYCPNCKERQVIQCQTHIASDYDGENGYRYHNKKYNLGESMDWWSIGTPQFNSWRVNGKKSSIVNSSIDFECCYSNCTSCKESLFVVIEFYRNISKKVLDIGFEKDWPQGFFR